MATRLSAARYGKDNVRVYKVQRDKKTGMQTVVEMTVCVLLEGDIETSCVIEIPNLQALLDARGNMLTGSSYTKGDNSVVVATDSMKNTIFILAKQHPVTPPELFGSIVGDHFIRTYKHVHTAHVSIVVQSWSRMSIHGKPHPHSFLRDTSAVRSVNVDVIEGKGIEIKSSISGLGVLKSTGSQFHGFVQDEYTTLKETWDRILSTDVDACWHWSLFPNLDQVQNAIPKFDATFDAVRDITLRTFAGDNSASVQNTMYKMAEQILAFEPLTASVDYALPNKHYFELGTLHLSPSVLSDC